MTTPIPFAQLNLTSTLSRGWMYDIAIQIPSGTHIGLPTSRLSTSRKRNETSFDPTGAHSTDRKTLSRLSQNKLNLVQHPRNYRIMKKFTFRPLIYSIKKNNNWLILRNKSPQQKSPKLLLSHDLLAEKTYSPHLLP